MRTRNPANLFSNEPISENFLRRDYPGMGHDSLPDDQTKTP